MSRLNDNRIIADNCRTSPRGIAPIVARPLTGSTPARLVPRINNALPLRHCRCAELAARSVLLLLLLFLLRQLPSMLTKFVSIFGLSPIDARWRVMAGWHRPADALNACCADDGSSSSCSMSSLPHQSTCNCCNQVFRVAACCIRIIAHLGNNRFRPCHWSRRHNSWVECVHYVCGGSDPEESDVRVLLRFIAVTIRLRCAVSVQIRWTTHKCHDERNKQWTVSRS